MPPSILIVGALEKNVEALENSYARAFSELGCRVTRWDPALALMQNSRYGRLGSLFSRFVSVEPWIRKANLQLLQTADSLQPDLILVIATSGVRAGTLAQVRVRCPRSAIYCLYPDSPHNLDNDRIASLPMFDRTFASSPAWVDSFRRLGAQKVEFLPFAADTFLHKPVKIIDVQPSYQVGFVGTWRSEREEILDQLSDFDLAIWGNDYWKTRTKPDAALKTKWMRRSLPAIELPDTCARTSVMLNIIDAHTWPGPNMRNFELPACGAFALVTRTPAITEFFQEGVNIECFADIAEARSKINYYLQHEDSRQKIAAASYQFLTEQKHTYVDRARQILGWVETDANNHFSKQ